MRPRAHLVFFYVDGARVAPPGQSHLTLERTSAEDGTPSWEIRGWEADEYGEWTGTERLDDDP